MSRNNARKAIQAMHTIIIEPTTLGDRGQRYRPIYHGSTIVESCRNPEFDACRVLSPLGITGELRVWRAGSTHPDMTLDIARAAKLTNPGNRRRGSATGVPGSILVGSTTGCHHVVATPSNGGGKSAQPRKSFGGIYHVRPFECSCRHVYCSVKPP
jgi:hypothetical protein